MTTYESMLGDTADQEYEETVIEWPSIIDNVEQDEDGVPGTGPKGQWTSIF